ncbi:double-strand break repair protein MRE11 isoform X1 [Hylaeus anthracinus]|uniref:double-strand break repair protein MRE11 isoform X1 n=2 Tax=Hylaeus anthracinus TaxID=313031 RepID=UPI0023B9DB8E|nr:double-strand break repair protein MRE11 isoform X1 [Hylaeus anthracinus]
MSSEPSCSKNIDEENTFKILIATDIHLGYDHNKKRGKEPEDSFVTFEEILQHGKEQEVDFILLGGDLFHDTKPSQTALIKCMELLRKYCLGSREIKVQFLSDPDVIFKHCTYKTVNYEDPNLNVSMPVFSIHGNHDDPSFGAVGSMDLLSVSGLVNYFGKCTDLTRVTIPPLIMKKGESHLALYGLSYINDERLSRLVRDYKVDMLRPTEVPECFNILVLHQNRVQHKAYGYIPQHTLPNFLNLIIWGHEHECRITPEFVPETEFFVSQPGSSVATSLCEGESKPKYIGILSINGLKFKMKKLKLKTVRPFVFDNLILSDQNISNDYTESLSQSVYNFVDNYVENVLMPQAAGQLTGHPKQPLQPLIRLRIFYSNTDELFDEAKLAQKYCDEVANPMDMVLFRKELKGGKKLKLNLEDYNDEIDDMEQALCFNDEDTDWNKTVQGGIMKHFNSEANRDKLTVLTVNGLNEALNRFVSGNDTDAFKDIVSHQMKKTISHLEASEVDNTESILDEIKSFRDKRMAQKQEEKTEIQTVFSDKTRFGKKYVDPEIDKISSDEEVHIDKVYAAKRKQGRAPTTRGRGSRGGGRGRAKLMDKTSLDVTTAKKTTKQTKHQTQLTLQSTGSMMNRTNSSKASFLLESDSE